MNAFMIFARKRRPEVAADNPNLRTGEISKLLSSEWKTIDNESKQFYLTKAKELKENFTSIFPTYVYKRRPNNSRKRRKTEETGYGGPGAINAIDRGEGGLSEDDGDMTPPGGLSPGMPHHPGHHHPMGGMPGMPGMGGPPGMPPRRDPGSMHLPPHHGGHGGMGVGPPHDLSYGMHGSQYGGPPPGGGGGPPPPHHRNQGSPTMHYDSVPGGSGGGGPGAPGGYGGPRNPGGSWPSLDHPVVKTEPKPSSSSSSSFTSFSSSYRLEGASSSSGGPPPHSSALRIPGGSGPSGPNGSTQGMRNGPSGGSYNFSIPSPNFGPGPGLPPIGRSGGGSNPNSASQTPLLSSGGPGGGGGGGGPGSMLPPPTTSGIYGHGSNHPGAPGGHGGHTHAHSGSYFDSSWPRTNQSPSTSSLNLNGPPGPGGSASSSGGGPSGGGGGGGPPGSNDRHTPNSRGRSDSLGGGPQSASSNSGQWSL
jgi:hypothetical protein